MNQWVVYLDESGRFEGGAAAAERPVVAGVMIPLVNASISSVKSGFS